MLDLRYHLISIVAVFLALAIGMLIGSSFLAGSSIEGLKREFAILRTENRLHQEAVSSLEDRLKKHKDFERAAMPLLVRDQLVWRRVAIVQTGDYSEAAQSAKAALDGAGAQIVSVTTLSDISSPGAASKVSRAVKEITGETASPDPVGKVLGLVARGIVIGDSPVAMDVMEKTGLLSRSGDYGWRVNRVIIVGGSKKPSDERATVIDLVLIDKLRSLGVEIVACEPFAAKTSYIPAWHRKDITTVDNIDDPTGQTALVFAVAGDLGNFGVKESADRIVPEYLEKGEWRSDRRR